MALKCLLEAWNPYFSSGTKGPENMYINYPQHHYQYWFESILLSSALKFVNSHSVPWKVFLTTFSFIWIQNSVKYLIFIEAGCSWITFRFSSTKWSLETLNQISVKDISAMELTVHCSRKVGSRNKYHNTLNSIRVSCKLSFLSSSMTESSGLAGVWIILVMESSQPVQTP
jgi:hypothetical protein